MTTPTLAGWYPDPSDSSARRWWDGQAWTASTLPGAPEPATTEQPRDPAAAPGVPAVPAVPSYGQPSATPQWQPSGTPQWRPVAASGGGVHHANRLALTTFAVVAGYLVLAVLTRIVFFGILPLGLSIRSARAKEPLAPLAVGAAVLSMVVAAAIIF